MKQRTFLRARGFTIAELTVVITVMAILAGIIVVAYGSWRSDVQRQVVQSDLGELSSAMESARNFNNEYPISLPSGFKASDSVNLVYKYGDKASYCAEASSKESASIVYHVATFEKSEVRTGACPAQPVTAPPIPAITQVAVVGAQAVVKWGVTTGATGYDMQYRTNSGTWNQVSTAADTYTVSSLALGATHEFQVRSKKTGAVSAWSTKTTRVTLPTPVISSVTAISCGNDAGLKAWVDGTVAWTATSKTYTATYALEGDSGATYGNSPLSIINATGSGTYTARASSTRWTPNTSSSGTIILRGIGPNGELSALTSWTSATFGPYEC